MRKGASGDMLADLTAGAVAAQQANAMKTPYAKGNTHAAGHDSCAHGVWWESNRIRIMSNPRLGRNPVGVGSDCRYVTQGRCASRQAGNRHQPRAGGHCPVGAIR